MPVLMRCPNPSCQRPNRFDEALGNRPVCCPVCGERFTLVGSDARRGKLTLFAAEGPREQGALAQIGLRVSDLEEARSSLPDGSAEVFEIGEGLEVTLVQGETDTEYDLDHVAVYSRDPARAAREWLKYGFSPTDDPHRVEVGGAFLDLVQGDPGRPEICPVFSLHTRFSKDIVDWTRDHCRTGELGCVDCKTNLADRLIEELRPIRERRLELASDPGLVAKVLAEGRERVRPIVAETMTAVRDAMGFSAR